MTLSETLQASHYMASCLHKSILFALPIVSSFPWVPTPAVPLKNYKIFRGFFPFFDDFYHFHISLF